ncbi:hypothetical protein AC1031_020683 [Aphanomyces cochlioides]|nr:hypothetical protein AC1031_020683 [Aphanomyces cochlioides]
MLHSALVTTDKANVLLARYFTPLSTEAKRVFEQALFKTVFSSAVSEHEAHLVVCDGQYVVYRKFGELIWFLAGSGHDILMTLLSVANVHFEKKCTEATFLANHAKILVCLDELVFHGHLDNNDVASILQMTKLKPYPLKAA